MREKDIDTSKLNKFIFQTRYMKDVRTINSKLKNMGRKVGKIDGTPKIETVS